MNLKRFASTRKGQLILCCGLLAAVWLVILLNWAAGSLGEIPNAARIAKVRTELAKVRRDHEKAAAEAKAAAANTAMIKRLFIFRPCRARSICSPCREC